MTPEYQKDKYLAFVVCIVLVGGFIATKDRDILTLSVGALGCLYTLLKQPKE